MLQRVHSLFGRHCARVNRDRVFNGEVFDTPESLEAFEAAQWNRDPTTTPAPCAGPRWADADYRPSHSDSIMVAIGFEGLNFDGPPTRSAACVIFFAPMSPFNQRLVCIQGEAARWFRNIMELEAAVRALQTVRQMILEVNPSIKQVVIKTTSPFLVRTATEHLPMLEETGGLLDDDMHSVVNVEALLDFSRCLRWRPVPHRYLEVSPNPEAIAPITAGLPHVYQPKGRLFAGVLHRNALFLPNTHIHLSETLNGREWVSCDVNVGPAKDTTVSLSVPAAMAPFGCGWVGVVGSVCADGETDQIISSMCGFE